MSQDFEKEGGQALNINFYHRGWNSTVIPSNGP